jgi:hypothetical protein
MRTINTLKELDALIGTTYMYAVIVTIVAVVVAFIIANLIKYQGGRNANDHIKRRIGFIVVGLIAPISFFLYNHLFVSAFITKAPLAAKFSKANIMATLIILGGYVVLGIVTMLIFRSSKWGSILGKSK